MFRAVSSGTVSATVTTGQSTFAVSAITTYMAVTEMVDPGELPPGVHPKPVFTTTWQVDQSSSGAPVVVAAGEHVSITVSGRADVNSPASLTGVVDINFAGSVVHVPMTMMVGDVTVQLQTHALTVMQGRSASIGVIAHSNAGPDTDVVVAVNGATPGVVVSSPIVHVAHLSSSSGSITFTTDRNLAPGVYHIDFGATAFAGQESVTLGGVDVTVTARPTLDLTADFGVAERLWNSHVDFLCDRLRDGAGQVVLANTGRTIRNPNCYLAPASITVTRVGNQLQLTGDIIGNWLSFYVTTPDGIPGVLDPKFQVDFDVHFSLVVDVPTNLDATSAFKIDSASLEIRNAKVDSHNVTADIIKAVAMLFGQGQYFHAADYGFSADINSYVSTINQTLAALNGPMHQAIIAGDLTSLTTRIDPSGHVVTFHLA
jgi:hypothetical protein